MLLWFTCCPLLVSPFPGVGRRQVRVVAAALREAERWLEAQLEAQLEVQLEAQQQSAAPRELAGDGARLAPPRRPVPAALRPCPWLADGLTHATLASVAADILDPCSEAGLTHGDALKHARGAAVVARATADDCHNGSLVSRYSRNEPSVASTADSEEELDGRLTGYGTGVLALHVTGNRHRVWGSWEVSFSSLRWLKCPTVVRAAGSHDSVVVFWPRSHRVIS